MKRVKDDKHYAREIMEDIDFVINHTKDINIEELSSNKVLLDSVMFRFIQISEKIRKISEEFKIINNHIPWFAILGLRNKIVHDYGSVDVTIVYDTVKNDLQELFDSFEKLIDNVVE